ncbi:GntR family transcriptional regulator [Mesorhizobium sp. VK9D]|uniref:GntR family transcriptional regulator n=1 Tax=Mesorhizobium australafricanum TaxID=3072311 RepID=UPI002A23CA0E|nr:GntR family transcriptional regulator [Mesorhizobium sp. VK9D]MDX8453410.1 GntR family transcriptional regulator [Mesorhizobium sp. VK9D]
MIYGKYIRSLLLISPLISIETNATFEPAATKAYRALEHMIVTLELAPSSFVTEGALIERLSLGRTPVREAIQRLAWEGLLDIRPRAGIAVAPLHAGDWLRVLDARRGIEVVLARSAARFVTREAADLFHEAALAMQKAVISGNVLAFIQADKALDEALAIAADNPFAARVAAPLQTHSRRFWYRYKADTGLAESAEHHVALIRSILDGDEEGAAKDAKKLMALLRGHAEVAATR